MAFDVGSVTATVTADIGDFKKKMGEAEGALNGFKGGLNKAGEAIVSIGKQAAIVTGVAAGGLTLFLKDASKEAANFEKAMISLDIIAGRFGVSGKQAQESAKALSKELRIGVGSSAEGLQNLLKSGLNLNQATDLMRRFTNEAITGKSANISLSEAVQNLSFAYATNNSALGNMSGVSENFEDIIVRGRESLIKKGKAVNDITDEMAKYEGMINLTNLTMGSSQRFVGTYIDTQAQLQQEILNLKVAIGQALNPILNEFIKLIRDSGVIESIREKLVPALEKFGEWISNHQELVLSFLKGIAVALIALIPLGAVFLLWASPLVALVAIIAGVYMAWEKNLFGIRDLTTMIANWISEHWDFIKTVTIAAFNVIVGTIKLAWEVISGVFQVALALIKGDWRAAWDALVNMTENAWGAIKQIFNGALSFVGAWGGAVYDKLTQPFRDAWGAIQDLVRKIRDAMDFTKRHSPSIMDILNRSVSLANAAFEKLDFGIPNVTPVINNGGNSQTTNPIYNSIKIDMGSSIITSEAEANRMGELIGNSIIRDLQKTVKF